MKAFRYLCFENKF